MTAALVPLEHVPNSLKSALFWVILVVYLGAFVLYIRERMWERSVLPLLLVLVPLLFMSVLLITRYEFLRIMQVEYPLASERYLFNYCLGWAGVI